MAKKRHQGCLIIVGGHEEKRPDQDRGILEEVARRTNSTQGPLVLFTVATRFPEETAREYTEVFRDLGVKDIEILDVRSHADASDAEIARKIDQASAVFFTGGDQLRITSQIGGSLLFKHLIEAYRRGLNIIGTSAGAAAMPCTMLIGGPGDRAAEVSALGMAPGLGLVEGMVIDSHFAERGRSGRLIAAVAMNPQLAGVGIDEDTAIVLDEEDLFQVIGSGSVYVVDGRDISYSSAADAHEGRILTIHDLRVHILTKDDAYDMSSRRPVLPSAAGERKGRTNGPEFHSQVPTGAKEA